MFARFRMLFQKVTECSEKFDRVTDIAVMKGIAHVINEHFTNFTRTAGAVQQIARERRCFDFRKVFVFRDRGDFSRIESAHSEAVFKSNHDYLSLQGSNKRCKM